MKNFCLYKKDRYGNCYTHGFLPVDEEGDVSIGRINKNGELELVDEQGKRIKGFYYKGKQYAGRDIFKGFDLIVQDINSFKFGETSLSEISEGLALINSLYMDLSTKIKPKDLVQYRNKIGFNVIFDKLGINRLITGHNPMSKLEKSGIQMVESDLEGNPRLFNIDYEMSPGYVKPVGKGGTLIITNEGVTLREFSSGEVDAKKQDITLISKDDFLRLIAKELNLIKQHSGDFTTALGREISGLLDILHPALAGFIVQPSVALADALIAKRKAAVMKREDENILKTHLKELIAEHRSEFKIAEGDDIAARLVALSDTELMQSEEKYLTGTMGIESTVDKLTGRVVHTFILGAHQVLLDAFRNHSPPVDKGMTRLFCEHEVFEYLALNRPESEVGKLFTAYLTDVLHITEQDMPKIRTSKNFHNYIYYLNDTALQGNDLAPFQMRLAEQSVIINFAHATIQASLSTAKTQERDDEGAIELGRLVQTLPMDERTKRTCEKVREYYRRLNYAGFKDRVKTIAMIINKAVWVREIYGLGYPFYGDINLEKRHIYTAQQIQKGAIPLEQFAQRLIPDMDLLIVIDSEDEGPWSVTSDISDRTMKLFIQQVSIALPQWKRIFAELSKDYNIVNKVAAESDKDPVDLFLDEGKLSIDMVPVARHVWENMPVFILREDAKNFAKITSNLMFTSEPLSSLSDKMHLLFLWNSGAILCCTSCL
jgi:hypothetical protein